VLTNTFVSFTQKNTPPLVCEKINGGVFGDMLFLGIKIYAKATFSLLFSLFSFLWKRQFERREKNEKRKAKSTKRNDNLLSKIVVSFWCG